ncbi:preQ(1) synthase [Streptomyces sp. NPDC126497]|uniref:preQ(1) synthase n=1 Tax=Streptomyces sp. NPDC126497 TaxID=3155313 RepID=UPI00331748C6
MTTYLGRTHNTPIAAADVDVVDVAPETGEVEFTTKEFQAVCPVTGQPDVYDLTIRFVPDGRSLESKSLKLYLWSFRDRGMYAEDIAATVARDLAAVLDRAVQVRAVQRPRGGLTLTASALINPPA